jgi:azurin
MKLIFSSALLFFLSVFSSLTYAACSFDIEVGDYLRFSSTAMSVEKSCGSVTAPQTQNRNFFLLTSL